MRILSIDGGGIKGLYSAAFLAAIERRENIKIGNYFRVIAGTSTGGILALALAAGLPASDIVRFYREWGPKIFQSRFRKLAKLRSYLWSTKYSNEPLKDALKSVFQDKTLNDIKDVNPDLALCIPTVNLTHGTPQVFKTAHESRLKRDSDYKLWEIALATSAAPTYFPIAALNKPNTMTKELYADGGVWANNPSQIALLEALTYLGARFSSVKMLSIGNLKDGVVFQSGTRRKKGLLMWKEKIVSVCIDTQSQAVHNQMMLLFRELGRENNYKRIEHNVGAHHSYLLDLDATTEAVLDALESLGSKKADNLLVCPNFLNFLKGEKLNG